MEKGVLAQVTGIGPVKTDSSLEKRRIKILSQESGRQNIFSVENGVPEPAEELICRVSELQGTSRGQWDQGHRGVYQHQSVSTVCIQTILFQNMVVEIKGQAVSDAGGLR